MAQIRQGIFNAGSMPAVAILSWAERQLRNGGMKTSIFAFSATIHKLGINPVVDVPEKIVDALLCEAGKKSAPVQVTCNMNGVAFDANIVRYAGDWRLYLNTPVRKSAGKDVGDTVKITLAYDPSVRMPPMPEAFRQALKDNADAQKAWRLRPTPKRREILEALDKKTNSAELARGIAETIEKLLKKS
jgi:Domain of unknown function (DUF1905)